MDGLLEVRTIDVSILRAPEDVYAFASRPENLPRWASAPGSSIQDIHGEWVADSPLGHIRIRFAERNEFGVLDHDVIFDSGETVHNPVRVVPNGPGSTVLFTILRAPGVSDRKFADDGDWVRKDLTALKACLEQSEAQTR